MSAVSRNAAPLAGLMSMIGNALNGSVRPRASRHSPVGAHDAASPD